MVNLVDIGDAKIACTVSGTGPPLLLMHGAEGSHRMFDAITPHLAPHFKVIAYDQRDCGGTQNPATPSSLLELAEDAKWLLLALGHQRAHVYGTSFGGRVAQAFALRHPRMVDRLVLGSTWPLPEALVTLNGEVVSEIQALRGRLPDSAHDLAGYFFPAAFLEANPELKDIFKSAQPRSERSQRRSHTVSDRPALDPRNLAMPTLFIAGALDQVVPAAVTMRMAADMANSTSVLLEGVGHAGVLQAPEVIAGHVRRFCDLSVSNDD